MVPVGFDDGEEHVPSLLYTQESSPHDSPSISDLDEKGPFSAALVPRYFEGSCTQHTLWHS